MPRYLFAIAGFVVLERGVLSTGDLFFFPDGPRSKLRPVPLFGLFVEDLQAADSCYGNGGDESSVRVGSKDFPRSRGLFSAVGVSTESERSHRYIALGVIDREAGGQRFAVVQELVGEECCALGSEDFLVGFLVFTATATLGIEEGTVFHAARGHGNPDDVLSRFRNEVEGRSECRDAVLSDNANGFAGEEFSGLSFSQRLEEFHGTLVVLGVAHLGVLRTRLRHRRHPGKLVGHRRILEKPLGRFPQLRHFLGIPERRSAVGHVHEQNPVRH
mmetsp:Transcript_8074/g.16720  ORF Transcript_8074/g.16720 Transcript_8074/m.16720 type:complete len:273 (+) Transcript_8074:2160-2978(+)